MAANASAGLIAALKASLADDTKGWVVQAVSESKSLASVSVGGGGGTLTSMGGTVDPVSGSSSESVRTRVELIAGAIIQGGAPMRLTYSEVKVGGSLSEAFIGIDGSELRTTDEVLNASIMAMAAAFQTARDGALIEALDAEDPLELPEAIAEGIITTLADTEAAWRCTACSEMAFYGGAGGVMRAVSLFSSAKRIGGMPANIQYQEQAATDGTLIVAQIMSGGGAWRTRNAELRAAILAIGDTFTDARSDDMESALA